MSAVFVARFHGECARCLGEIAPGDKVLYVGDELLHAGCVDREQYRRPGATKKTAEVCTTCWLTKPCECDDERKTA